MPELTETLLNRLGIADAMAHRAKATAGRLQQAAAKHHDAQNTDIDALGKQIEAAGVGADEDAENRYCRALVARGHMAQAHHLAGLDAARMPEVGSSLEKGQESFAFDEEKHPGAGKGESNGGRFVSKDASASNQKAEPELLRDCMEFGKRTGRERLVLLNADTGETVERDGDEDGTVDPAGPYGGSPSKWDRLVVLHNHPEGGTFSPQDLEQFADMKNMVRASIVLPDGEVHTFTPPEDGSFDRREARKIGPDFRVFVLDVRERLGPDAPKLKVYHTAMEEVLKKHGVKVEVSRLPGALEKGRISQAKAESAGQAAMDFEENQHPRAAVGTAGQYEPGEFVPKGEQQGAAEKPDHEKEAWELSRSEMKPSSDYDKSYMSNYVDAAGNKTASSRTTPAQDEETPLGTWRRDDYKGSHGTEVEQLRELDPNDLTPSEDTDAPKKADVERYTEWAKEGKKAPPIHVVETDSGKLKISNGHRRWLAAKAAGTKIRAWVSPATTIPGQVDSEGRPMKTGLTHELAIHHAIEAGHRVPDEVLHDYPELKEQHDQKRKEALRDAAQSAQEDGHLGLAAAQEKSAEAQAEREPWQQTKKEFEADGDLVYHGGSGEYEIETDRGGKATGNVTSGFGAFFTPHKAEAERYVKGFHGGKGAVNVAKLDLKNPYNMPFEEFDDVSKVDWNGLGLQGGRDEIRQRVAKIKRDLLAAGYDGIIVGKPGQKVPPRFPTALPNDERSQEIIAFHQGSIIQHRKAVSQALQEGKPVPPEVLADYPDLERDVARGGELNKAVLRTFHHAGQIGMEFDEEQHPREAKGAATGGYKPGEFVPKDAPEKAPWQQSRADYLAARPLPKEDYGWPQEGEFPFVVTDNGAIYIDKNPANSTHILFAEKLGIPAERIVSGGFLRDGELDDMGARSDAARYGEQARAKRRSEHRRAVANALAEGKDVPKSVLQDYPDLAEKGRTETLDRPLDWRLNGVRGQAFKSWFGDWQDDPKNASKVLNEEGEPAKNSHLSKVAGKDGKPRRVYHGTGKGGFRVWDKTKTNWNGLFGGGFYFTEDRNIAKEYENKESPIKLNRDLTDKDMKAAERFLHSAKVQRQVREDFEGAEKFKQTVRAWKAGKEEFQRLLEAGPTQNGPFHILTALKIGSTFTANRETFEVYLNIRKPLDVDSEVSPDQVRQFHEALGEDHPERLSIEDWHSATKAGATWEDVFDDAISSPSPEERGEQWKSVYRALAAMGHDGLTHIGGGRYNSADGERHRVWIAFEPAQIKSADNTGTFDPNDPDMYKAVRRPFVPPDMPRWRGPRPSPNSYLPLNGVEDREKFLAMAKEMAAGTWTWDKPLIRCGDQLLTGSHRYAAAQTAGVPLETLDVDDLFKRCGRNFQETWERLAQPYTSWLNNMDAALKTLPPEILALFGIDLG